MENEMTNEYLECSAGTLITAVDANSRGWKLGRPSAKQLRSILRMCDAGTQRTGNIWHWCMKENLVLEDDSNAYENGCNEFLPCDPIDVKHALERLAALAAQWGVKMYETPEDAQWTVWDVIDEGCIRLNEAA